MPRKKAEAQENSVSLYAASSFLSAWDDVLLPWFDKVAIASPASEKPAAIIVPARPYAHFLRRRLLDRRRSLLGVRFFTPPQLREFLLRSRTIKTPLREHLRLLLAMTAEEVVTLAKAAPVDAAIAKSIARDPDNFLSALDQFRAAGFEPTHMEPALLAKIATRFEKRVYECGFVFVHEADRALVQDNDKDLAEFSDLLVVGFNGAHWPLWPLLRAGARRADYASVILNDPRDEARDLDETWIGTWEEHFGECDQIAPSSNETAPFLELTRPLESNAAIADRRKNPLSGVHFQMGRDTSEQALAIATVALSFLNAPSSDTIAILLPGPGALARLVARALDQVGISHNDSIAHAKRGTFDDEEWRAWLELQRRPQVGPLLRFLAHSPAAAGFFAKLQLREIERSVRHACGDILINDVTVLAEYCNRCTDGEKPSIVAKGLRAIRLLPERATLSRFLDAALSIFRALGWRERIAELERLSREWSATVGGELPRTYFLRWLTDVFTESAFCRDPHADHPYARVQLLRYDQAENQTWSHLILGGLNEGSWPKRDDESSFLGDEQIAALNAQQRELNRRATREGRFGAGQTIVREGATLCLGARERRDLALRQLLNAIEATTGEIGIAAQLYNTSPREQAVNPSEFYAQLYFNARGDALSQSVIEQIHSRTIDWLQRGERSTTAKKRTVDVDQTLAAYRARRRPEQSFGEYEFAFSPGLSPNRQISLSATEAARIFTAPALVWMKRFLGVESDERDIVSWNLTTGQWVHRWLATLGCESRENSFVPKSSKDEIVKRVDQATKDFQEQVTSILAANYRALPDWWISGWRNARYLAERFAEEVASVSDWPQLSTELRLDPEQSIRFDDRSQLLVRGRVDLLLTRGEDPARELWIVDYKTGVAAALKPQANALRKQLTEGNGVQICIYALALCKHFGREIYVSLLSRETDLTAPQLSLADILAQDRIWKEIVRMQKTGVFGMLGEIRSEFRFTGVYPLATLAIDKDFLRDKWRRSHPAFA